MNNPVIFALDAESLSEARRWVKLLAGKVGLFKIGLQLFIKEGPRAVEMVQKAGAKVFLDLKLHDIPHTVEKAARECARMNVAMFNVHALGGMAMMKAAARAAREEADKLGTAPPLVLAVTVLTSLDRAALEKTGIRRNPENLAIHLAGFAKAAGLQGVVASPREVRGIKKKSGSGFIVVCPGIRPWASARGDQARADTPAAAIRAGADFLVIGRPIRDAKNPERALEQILKEIESARVSP